MARLVERRNALFLLGDDLAFLLRTDTDLYKGFLYIVLHEEAAVSLRREDRRLIEQVLQVCPGKARRRLRDLLQIDVLRQRLVLRVHL